MRSSSYNIYVSLENEENEYILFNGFTGTIDVVSKSVYDQIDKAANGSIAIEDINKDILDILIKRGYITEKTEEVEREEFRNVVSLVQKHMQDYVNFTIMPTYNCNFRCSYCFEKNRLKNGTEWLEANMKKEVVDRIFSYMDELEAEGKKVSKEITLYGGEPLLKENHDIVKYFVDKCVERSIKLSAITNGYDLTYFKDVLGKGKIERLQITIDGIGDYHNKKRFLKGNMPTFDTIVSNIDEILELDVIISIRSNIDVSNIDQIDKLVDFYKHKGWVKKENFEYYFKNVHNCYIDKKKYVDEEKLWKKMEEANGSYENSNIGTGIAKSLMYMFEKGKPIIPRASFCGATSAMLVVDPFGDVYPCWEVVGQKEDCCIGNIMEGISKENKIYKYWRERDINHIEACSKCSYAIFCGGGCPAHVRSNKGDIYLPHCTEYKELFVKTVREVYTEFMSKKNS